VILDTLIYLAAINASCAFFDGAAFLESREFPSGYEGNTVIAPERGPAKYLAGEYPTMESFLIAGAVEVITMTAISYMLKRCGVQKFWWFPQIGVSILHGYYGYANIKTHRYLMQYGKERGYY
jgi:hypothetical protein